MQNADRARAILMVSMEPPASLEEEFNDWYDTEHFPQRRAMPGFESASRWVCLDGWPRWMALYDLCNLGALDSDAYRAASGANSTPWSRRLLPRTIGRRRVVASALTDHDDHTTLQHPIERTSRLVVAGVPVESRDAADAIVHAARNWADSDRGVLQLRAFLETLPDAPASGVAWLIFAFATPVDRASLAPLSGRLAGHSATVLNVYAPYRRGP
ncbi:hypothetical protein [Burkholderia sp. 3C]